MSANTTVIALPTMTQTSSAVDTSTGSVPAWDVSDAQALTVTFTGTTTAPGPQAQVALTSDPSATFFTLVYNTSGAGVVLTSSTIALTLFPIAAKQIRFVTTSIRTGSGVHNGNKLVIL